MNLDLSHLPAGVIASLTTLVQSLQRRREGDALATPAELGAFESSLRELTMAVERSALEGELQRLDVDAPGIEVGGHGYRRTVRSPLEVVTAAGTVRVEQTMYRMRGGHGGETVGAVALRAGLVAGAVTPAAARLLCHLVAQMPPSDVSAVLQEFGALRVSTSTLDRVAKRVAAEWEADSAALYEAVRVAEIPTLPNREEVAAIVAGLDGVMVATKEVVIDPKTGKPSRYREASSATLQLLNAEGECLHVIRFARMPEAGKPSLAAQLLAELQALRLRYPQAKLHIVADGAKENWRIHGDITRALGVRFDSELVDYYHAAQHLTAGLKAAGVADKDISLWRSRLRDQPGAATDLLIELARRRAEKALLPGDPAAEPLDREVTYFRNNHERMRYVEAAQRKLPIGSGMQEAACKTLVVERLKQSGMSWGNKGGDAILLFRSLLQSGRYEPAWSALVANQNVDVTAQRERCRKPPTATPRSDDSIRQCG